MLEQLAVRLMRKTEREVLFHVAQATVEPLLEMSVVCIRIGDHVRDRLWRFRLLCRELLAQRVKLPLLIHERRFELAVTLLELIALLPDFTHAPRGHIIRACSWCRWSLTSRRLLCRRSGRLGCLLWWLRPPAIRTARLV